MVTHYTPDEMDSISDRAELEEAWEHIRDYAEELKASDRMEQLGAEQVFEELSDNLREAGRRPEWFDSDDAGSLQRLILVLEAMRLVGPVALRERYPLPEPEPEDRVYRDGSRASLVVREEVSALVDTWALHPVETLLEVLEWSDAARDAFSDAFQLRYGQED